jgi:hypothetical protein
MEKKRINMAVSELIGAILLLAIVTSVMALVFYQVSLDKGPHKQTFVKLVGKVQQTNFILEHQGGDSLGSDTSISLALAGKKYNYTIGDILVDTNHNGFWDLGEKLVFPFTYDMNNLSKYNTIDVMSVDKDSNSIQFFGSVELNPVVDLGVKTTVSNFNPYKNDIINVIITLTCYGGDINGSAIIQVRYPIPYGLQYISSNAEIGTYDNTTSIWSIDQIGVQSVTLNITLKVISEGSREFTQIVMIMDGSGSIVNSDWNLMRHGLFKALTNDSIFPHDNSVELTVIQFGSPYPNKCTVEVSPTIVNASNFHSIATNIETLVQGQGGTPMAAGIYLATDTMRNSKNFDGKRKQIVFMITDGKPTYWSNPGEYVGQGDGAYTHDIDLQTTEDARNYSVTHLEMTEDMDGFNVLAVGTNPDIPWLNNSIVWPQPGHIAPPYIPERGWVSNVTTWEEFSERISQIFTILFQSISLKTNIISAFTHDPNSANNVAQLWITPKK